MARKLHMRHGTPPLSTDNGTGLTRLNPQRKLILQIEFTRLTPYMC